MAFHMTRKQTGIVAGVVVLLGLGGTGAAIGTSNGSDDGGEGGETAITGSAYDQAAKAALAEAGGGKVTGTEAGDEESYYEVEVTLDNGQQVDVGLDKDFHVVSSETEGPEHEDD